VFRTVRNDVRDRLASPGLPRPPGAVGILALTLEMLDLIVVLNAGAVEDTGTHDELMDRKRSYALTYRQQAAAFA